MLLVLALTQTWVALGRTEKATGDIGRKSQADKTRHRIGSARVKS